MKIAVIGAGYVGLVAAACFAESGNDVTLIDSDEERISCLRCGGLPVFEPGLDELVSRNRAVGRLHLATGLSNGLREMAVIVLAVGTPSMADGDVDLSQAESALRSLARVLGDDALIVVKSTVPVGFHKLAEQWLRQEGSRATVVSNPEFMRQGSAVRDFQKPDRVVIGTKDSRVVEIMTRLYAEFTGQGDRLLVMDPASAELTKYACNAMLATRISFMNEMSALCEDLGANATMVRRGMGSDPRIGPHYLRASLGYGGSCLPKDVRALIALGRSLDVQLSIIEATHLANGRQAERFFSRISSAFEGELGSRKLAVWGLAFKASTDDVRESAAIGLVARLLRSGARVAVHDPRALGPARAVLGEPLGLTYAEDPHVALHGAEALVICTEWPEYRDPDFVEMRTGMARPLIFDGRNLYEASDMERRGFEYISVGRRTHVDSPPSAQAEEP